jgi:threonine dehydratase
VLELELELELELGSRNALMTENLARRIAEAEARIRPHVRETPVAQSLALSDVVGADVWLKCENLQVTGSFKVRGATNRLLTLPDAARRRGVVAASSGNHGIAVSHAGRASGMAVTVYVPEGASPAKIAAMRRLGASVVLHGTDGLDTEVEARRIAASEGRAYVSPYNDLEVVAGQGTVGVELRRQLEGIDAVVVAVGGGGLISGIAAELKRHDPKVRIIGAQPANSRVMAESVRAGQVVDIPSLPTLSDGTAGGIEADTITFPFCRTLVDEWVEVEEAAIARGMRHAVEVEHMLVEGSAGLAIAALSGTRRPLHGRVVVVLCGANISAARLREVL